MHATALYDCLSALARSGLAGLFGLICAAPALATTWTVDSTSADPALNACTAAAADCSFPGAVSRLASSGDTIAFAVASSSANGVEIAKSVTIEANGASLPSLSISSSLPVIITATIRNARWEDRSGLFGAALYVGPSHVVTLEDVQFRRNTATALFTDGGGGAILNYGFLTVRRGVFEANRALQAQGGAIASYGGSNLFMSGSVTILDSRFESNYAQQGGSAIHNSASGGKLPLPITVRNSSFVANGLADPANPDTSARGYFGAIKTDAAALIESSYFADNDSRYASAIQAGSNLTVINSTFWRNVTRDPTGEGGALLLGGATRLVNISVVGNTGTPTGGLFVYPGADVRVVNSLFADNQGSSPEISGRIYSIGNNLIRNPAGATIEGNTASNVYGLDARWQVPANHGGPTFTAALAVGSPAIDAGSDCVLVANGCGDTPPTAQPVDQRGAGFPRRRGASADIGAFESAWLLVSNVQDAGTGSLRQAIADAQGGETVVFARPYFDQARSIDLLSTLVINKALTIEGPGAGLLTLDAGRGRRHLNVDAGGNLLLSGLRFTRGDPGGTVSGGALLVNGGGTLDARDLVVEDNAAQIGGCVYNVGTLTFSRVRLSNCRARAAAGAVFNASGANATLGDIRIEGSSAVDNGGAIGNAGSLLAFRVAMIGNQARFGGAFSEYGTTTLRNSTISGNTATGAGGGGIHVDAGGRLTLTHGTVTLNTATTQGGGGVWNNGGVIDIQNSLIDGNTGAGGIGDVRGVLRSLGHNLIGNMQGSSFAADSPSLVGNLLNVSAALGPLAENGGFGPTHAPNYDSPVFDAAASALGFDARGLIRPRDFTHLANAPGGNGSDIGAYELQVSTPTNVVAAPAAGGLSVSFNGDANGGPAISSYRVVCGAQSATGTAAPILVGGLANGVAVTCTVTASSDNLSGIPSAPSNSAAPAVPPGAPTIGTAVAGNGQVSVVFNAPTSDGGSPITSYTATCGARSASASASPISVIGLINGAATSCSVKATNAVGSGPASASSNSVTPGLPGAYAYVAKGGTDAAVINLANNAVVATIPLISSQTGVAASPDGSRVYLVSQGTDEVTVINTQTNAVVTRITVPNRPWSAVVSPDSTLVYVTQSSGNAISVISAATNSVVATIPNIQSGYGIAITPDGQRLYVAPAGGSFVYTVDTTTYATATVGVGNYPVAVAVSADGARAYVTAIVGNNLTVIDNTTATPIATIAVGSNPYGVTVSPDSARVYVANSNSNSVSVIDAQSLSVIATVPVGAQPRGIDVSPDSSRAYVINQGSANVSVIDAASNSVTGSIAVGGGGAMYSMGDFMVLGGAAPAFTSAAPGNGLYGVPYSHALTASGIAAPSFALQSGALPAGLSLNPATGAISGTPTAVGAAVNAVVRASNGVGTPVTQAISIAIAATVPDAPTITGISAGDGSVTVSFAPPANNGGAAITMYNAFCGGFAASNSTSPITVGGQTNGVAVTCTVNALNAVGGGVASAPSAAVTPGVAPAFTSATLPGGTYGTPYQQTLTAAGSPAPTYALASGTLPTGLSLNASSGQISGTPSSVGSFSGSISASNGIGTAAMQAFAIGIAAGLPAAPTAVVATRGNGEVSVAFAAPTNTGGVALSGYSASCAGQSANGNAAPITVTGLSNGSAVTCTVVAHNSAGSSPPSAPSNSVTPATVPGAPVVVSATPANGSATVTFSLPANNGAPILDYTASCTPGAATSTGAGTTLTIGGLSNGVLYQCSVRARNEVGSGVASAPISVIPAAVLSADLAITVTNNSGYVTGGASTTYLIRVSNPGPAGVANARVEDVLGSEFSGASWTCSGQNGGQCSASGNGNLDQRVDLPVGSMATFTLTATVAALPETPISNIASVTPPAAIADPALGNNVGSDGPDVRGLFRDGLE